MSAGVVLNAILASAAAACALAPLTGLGAGIRDALSWLAFMVQVAGGLIYRATQEFEPGPDRLLRRVWRLQIVTLFLFGTTATVASSIEADGLTQPVGALLWLVLGFVFIVGMYGYDMLVRRWFARARLEEEGRQFTEETQLEGVKES